MGKLNVTVRRRGVKADRQAEALMKKAAAAAFGAFGFDFDAQADITVVTDGGIRAINSQYRGVDAATDVLSFPMHMFSEGKPLDPVDTMLDPDSGNVFLGDIIISTQRAIEQAEEFGHGIDRECAYLTVHSVLHLLGFDHTKAADKKRMRAVEEKVLLGLGLERMD